MKKIAFKAKVALLAASCLLAPIVSYAANSPIHGNIRVVIGSKSTGGDTYQASSIIADALAKQLDTNIKVDAVGFSEAYRALERVRSGNTIMMYHDQSYLGYLYQQPGYVDPFKKFIIGPTFAINPGNGYLVPKNSPYKTVDDIINAAGNGKRIRVAIQPGGVSEIGFTALKNAVRLKYPGKQDNLVAINTGSQADKNQTLFDDLADVINGSVQANEQYTRLPADDKKAMRFIWLTAKSSTIAQANPEGLGQTSRAELMKYASGSDAKDQGVHVPMDATHDFTFDKEFYILYNKNTPPKVIAYIDNALKQVFADGKVEEKLKKSFFIPDFRPSKEAQTFIKAKSDRYAEIINDIRESK